MLAIRAAAAKLGAPRLVECDLYVTLEPCPMCAQAISFARIRRLYWGAAGSQGRRRRARPAHLRPADLPSQARALSGNCRSRGGRAVARLLQGTSLRPASQVRPKEIRNLSPEALMDGGAVGTRRVAAHLRRPSRQNRRAWIDEHKMTAGYGYLLRRPRQRFGNSQGVALGPEIGLRRGVDQDRQIERSQALRSIGAPYGSRRTRAFKGSASSDFRLGGTLAQEPSVAMPSQALESSA